MSRNGQVFKDPFPFGGIIWCDNNWIILESVKSLYLEFCIYILYLEITILMNLHKIKQKDKIHGK